MKNPHSFRKWKIVFRMHADFEFIILFKYFLLTSPVFFGESHSLEAIFLYCKKRTTGPSTKMCTNLICTRLLKVEVERKCIFRAIQTFPLIGCLVSTNYRTCTQIENWSLMKVFNHHFNTWILLFVFFFSFDFSKTSKIACKLLNN